MIIAAAARAPCHPHRRYKSSQKPLGIVQQPRASATFGGATVQRLPGSDFPKEKDSMETESKSETPQAEAKQQPACCNDGRCPTPAACRLYGCLRPRLMSRLGNGGDAGLREIAA